jgi:pSer/pThr/pTyr-binding forkhead associated (FHA) protein
MTICPHCGWENPGEAAFCTNCGRGLGRARNARLHGLEESGGDRPVDAGRRFRALDSVGRTARDHEMPLVDGGAPGPEPLDAHPSPVASVLDDPRATDPDEESVETPRLRPPPGTQTVRDSMPTLVDFRMPIPGMAAQSILPASSSTVDFPPAPDPMEVEPSESEATLDLRSRGSESRPAAVPLLVGLLPKRRPTRSGPIEPLIPATPDPTQRPPGETPGAPPVRIARIIEPITDPSASDEIAGVPDALSAEHSGDEPVSIPGLLLEDSIAPADEDAPVEQDAPVEHDAPPLPDVAAIPEVDLDGDRDDDVEDFEDLSASDLDAVETPMLDLDPPDVPLMDAHLVESGEQARLDVEPQRPPARVPSVVDARFILRPMSENVAEQNVLMVGLQPLVLGRVDADVCIAADLALSPQHARLTVEDDALWVQDLDSVNGTWLRVRGQAMLGSGAGIRVGHQVLRLDHRPAVRSVPEGAGTRRLGASRPKNGWRLSQLADDGLERAFWSIADEGARIGRHVADVVFPEDTFMSGTHALLLPRPDGVQLRDLGSRNGTWVRLEGRHRLEPGDAVLLGETVWRVGVPV